ncbi:MAG: hypothetical protein ABI981_04450 [Betaproteobacteria bacterium]
MNKHLARRKQPSICAIVSTLLLASCVSLAAAVEPEKQPIYSNTPTGLLCGTNSTNACKVPAGKRLIIEYVSGFAFQPLSSNQMTSVTMVVTDTQLGLNGNSFHTFPATKVNTTSIRDVFAFSAPLKMMLSPNASFYFAPADGIAVSGYLVTSN